MSHNLKDIFLRILKIILWSLIIISIIKLVLLDYYIGIWCCEFMNIPKDLAISIVSPGFVYEITILLLVIESILIFLVIKYSKKNKVFARFFEFMCLECYFL